MVGDVGASVWRERGGSKWYDIVRWREMVEGSTSE